MSKKIVLITGSPRKSGNTEILADSFLDGAREGGNTVTIFNAGRMNVNPCTDCQYCFSHEGACCQQDDMQEIYQALYAADMVVFASPVYWYGLTAQIKAVIDRMYVHATKAFPVKDTALLLVYADTDKTVEEPTIAHYKAFTGYLGWENKGIIVQPGVAGKGDINSTEALKAAYEFGKQIS